jgi:MFS family permease
VAPIWAQALLATLAMQTINSVLLRTIPTLGPTLTEQAGLGEHMVGVFTAVGTFGSILLLLAGAPILRRFGPVRMLQLGVLLGAAACASLVAPHWSVLLVASLAIGMGYAPSAPAGSDILQRYAPAKHRSLVFSIKQAGAPLGGALSGLLAPVLAVVFDWRVALLATAGLALLVALAVQPARAAIDAGRDRAQRLHASAFLNRGNLAGPARALRLSPALAPLSFAGLCYAVNQGAFFGFLVTYAVVVLDHPLTTAGALFATTQATGVVGRIVVGWIADRVAAPMFTLMGLGVACAATMVALATTHAGWPLWALFGLAAVAGVTVSTWNGLVLAEVARAAPPHAVAEATAGSTVLVFVGYVLGPALFTVAAMSETGYRVGFASLALVALAGAFALWRGRRSLVS